MARVLVLGSIAESLTNFRGPLLREMVACGHEVFACSPNATKEIRNRLLDMGVVYHEIQLNRAGMNPFKDIQFIFRFTDLIKKIKPDVYLGYTIKPVIYGSFAARLSGVSEIYSMITGLGYAFNNTGIKGRITSFIAQNLYSLALNFNRNVFFQNPDDLHVFKDKGLIKSVEKAVIINGSGVDINLFRPVPLPESPSFLLIARLIKDKGIYEYVEAARIIKQKHPEVIFRLVGFIDNNPTAITDKDLQSWVESGIIEYHGYLLDVRPAIADSSVYVLPSYHEGTPHSVLEAMAMGRPIVTTDTSGCRETVEDGKNGFLVQVRDVSSLVKAIEFFIREPVNIGPMGNTSRRIAVEKYDVHKVNSVILSTMRLA